MKIYMETSVRTEPAYEVSARYRHAEDEWVVETYEIYQGSEPVLVKRSYGLDKQTAYEQLAGRIDKIVGYYISRTQEE